MHALYPCVPLTLTLAQRPGRPPHRTSNTRPLSAPFCLFNESKRHNYVLVTSMRLEKVSQMVKGDQKSGPKRRRTYQKWSKNQLDMFNNVYKHPESRYRATKHMQFPYRLILVKCRFKGDISETSFRSLCKMAFLA